MRCIVRFLSTAETHGEGYLLLRCYQRGDLRETVLPPTEDLQESLNEKRGEGEERDHYLYRSISRTRQSQKPSAHLLPVLPIVLSAEEKVKDWKDLFAVHYSASSCALLKACLMALGWNEELATRR